MAHEHNHAPANFDRAFTIGIALNVILVITQVIYGLSAHSIALLADAGHNLGDVMGLVLGFGATIMARRLPTKRHTYGLRRASILAALINGAVLLLASGGIAWEALRRLSHPEPVAGGIVAAVAGVAILVNGGTALLFISGQKADINIRGAFLHMAADAGVSLGVLLAGMGIYFTGWQWLEPAMSMLVVAAIIAGTWSLLREALRLSLDGVPVGIDPEEVQTYLENLPGVTEVHDLHIWGMSTTETALTAHLVLPGLTDDDALLARACVELHNRFGIEHATLQLEHGDGAHPCSLAPVDVV
jgi:cobalt-zinc-cadmium efflux system protein